MMSTDRMLDDLDVPTCVHSSIVWCDDCETRASAVRALDLACEAVAWGEYEAAARRHDPDALAHWNRVLDQYDPAPSLF